MRTDVHSVIAEVSSTSENANSQFFTGSTVLHDKGQKSTLIPVRCNMEVGTHPSNNVTHRLYGDNIFTVLPQFHFHSNFTPTL